MGYISKNGFLHIMLETNHSNNGEFGKKISSLRQTGCEFLGPTRGGKFVLAPHLIIIFIIALPL